MMGYVGRTIKRQMGAYEWINGDIFRHFGIVMRKYVKYYHIHA